MMLLGQWLKHLVLIVLISIIADLLLPTKSMQKYVRAVLGIAIIAAMIQPITPLFHRDWADQIANTAAQELLTGTQRGGVSSGGQIDQSTLSTYESQIEKQETHQADTILADATEMALPGDLRAHVVKLTIQNANQPDKLQAVVETDTTDVSVRSAIVKQIAGELHVSGQQVTIRMSGGE
ncbi:stage III sporulation protein AF [Alicyclobacillus dauci]|uniref:Stage III sporulation protein AF n=1 Tax=Alicyclobacillus dauci TaxID=1475485 RepID=A0ABY6Z7X5_9BACL|nr:stage III sporulation protein AF [Alicyclobacillus dauci]WAH39000.1 stage III sporulation protein AF [Alicyclobacillus dauci]